MSLGNEYERLFEAVRDAKGVEGTLTALDDMVGSLTHMMTVHANETRHLIRGWGRGYGERVARHVAGPLETDAAESLRRLVSIWFALRERYREVSSEGVGRLRKV